MSYRCDNCDAIRNGEELTRISELRNVNYNRVFNRKNRRDKTVEVVLDSTYQGTEFVKIDKLCESCYDKWRDIPAKVSNQTKEVNFFGKKKQPKVDKQEEDDKQVPDLKGLKERFEGVR
jgi:hypothetical protein